MKFTGQIQVSASIDPQIITIKTDGEPHRIQITAEPTAFHCGGSAIGVSYPQSFPDGFAFELISNTAGIVRYEYTN